MPARHLFFILILLPAYYCEYDDPDYSECQKPYNCGHLLNLSYPFWGDNRPEFCGHEGFRLTHCQHLQGPTIASLEQEFRVIHVNTSQNMMTIARRDLYDDVCPVILNNITFDETIFRFVPDLVKLSLVYNCTTYPFTATTVINSSCSINGSQDRVFYGSDKFWRENLPDIGWLCDRVEVPVRLDLQALEEIIKRDNTAGDKLEEVRQLLKNGFNVSFNHDEEISICKKCEDTGGICGTNLSTLRFNCFCPGGYNIGLRCQELPVPDPDPVPVPGKAAFRIGRWLTIGGSAAGVVILVFTVYCCVRRLSSYTSEDDNGIEAFLRFLSCERKEDKCIEKLLRNHGSLAPKRYSYSEVKKMTRSFKDKLGQGGYGSVFKGKLPKGCLVAVKVLKKSKSNGVEFINEVASISRTSHVNIVTLLGFCFHGSKRILIYEFMPNGSLDKYIYKENGALAGHQLDCEKLFQIVLGVARGLEYLHRGCNTRILHFDIKPQNVLLDENFCPKISDFGLAKICPERESNISMKDIRGTIGYIAPEVFCRNFGEVSHKSDVYSYGMLVLEIMGGRQSLRIVVDNTSEIYFPHWIHKRLEFDEELRLPGINSEEENIVIRKMVLVSLWCIQTNPSNRPPMNRVVEMLQASLESLPIPPRPYLSSPPRAPEISVASSRILSSELLDS